MPTFDAHCKTPGRRIDGVLVVGLTACAGSLAWAAPVETALATAIVLVVFARRGDRRWAPIVAILASIAFFVTAARATRKVAAYERARTAVVAGGTWPARCAVEGVVSRSPVLLGDALKVDVEITRGGCEVGILPGEMTLPRPLSRVTIHVANASAPPLARGDTVAVVAQLAPGYRFWNDATGDPRPPQARRSVLLSGGAEDVVVLHEGRGLAATIDRARARFRDRIVATFPPDTAAMARALVLGEEDLTSSDQRAFRRSGLAHLLAVSGMHLVLIVASFVAVVRALLVRMPILATRVAPLRVASALGVPLAWIYADLAGASGSAIRAAWMSSVVLLAHALSRRPDPWRAFGVSVAGMVVVDPLVAFDFSFTLSAAATGGLLALGSRMAAPLLKRTPSWLSPVIRALAASLAASLVCAPVLACMTADLPIAGLIANLVAVPLGEMAALPLCLAHALLEPWPAAERGCALAASGALALVRGIARTFAALPWGAAPVPTPSAGQLAALGLGAFALAIAQKPRRWVAACAVALALMEYDARARGSPKGLLRVTFLDVGQGDAAIIDLPDGSAMVIDGGGLVGSPVDVGERVVAPVLRARRRSSVALVVLSHPHPDHFAGLRRGLASVRVGAFWDTGQGEVEGTAGEYAMLLSDMRRRGAPVLHPRELCGTHTIGGVRVDVLAPCPDLTVDRGANDNSFVIRIAYGGRSFLFVGDAEHAEEADLTLFAAAKVRSDVLKVGHHGSRTSTTASFLTAVAPSIAVVSCGIRNRFGHPAPSSLATLAASRARIFRTDRDGAVTITTDGQFLEARGAAE